MILGIANPLARASAIASTRAGWSLPKLAKMQETPASVRASRSAALALGMERSLFFRNSSQRVGDLAQERDQLGLVFADDLVEATVVSFDMAQQGFEFAFAAFRQSKRDAAPVGNGGTTHDQRRGVQLTDERRDGRFIAADRPRQRALRNPRIEADGHQHGEPSRAEIGFAGSPDEGAHRDFLGKTQVKGDVIFERP